MNNSRRKFLGKAPAVAVAAGVGIASGKIAMASPSNGSDGTRALLDVLMRSLRVKERLTDFFMREMPECPPMELRAKKIISCHVQVLRGMFLVPAKPACEVASESFISYKAHDT